MEAKKTPLYDEHVGLGGKVVDYAGWYLPVQYEGLIAEHEAVRNAVGLFDVSHMGEITVKGKDALAFVDYLMTNDISKVVDNQIVYTFMCAPDGGVVDDLLVYRLAHDDYYLVVNASNTAKDYKWILEQKGNFDVEITNISDTVGEVAIQGPLAQKVLQKLTKTDLNTITFFTLNRKVDINGVECMVSRTGYTGEDGFEVYTTNEGIVKVWKDILEAGKEEGIKPCGLGCRDTLRFEASLPLYGHEISAEINPLEGGFKYFVKLDKASDFIGKEALNKQWKEGLKRKLAGFEMIDRGIPREGYEIQKDGKVIGHVTTGYMSPTLKKNIGNALISPEYTELGTEIDIMIRNKPAKAKIISKKFLNNK
ncbi:glycine cleavage system aminomethyltransferase GcvT [Tissierella praeacuta]|uniref:Aminomethyltransferase n=2 Tax=Tissierella praeacuta TaxID=43131 RepID=A0A1M4YB00_9FIRM|nr:glycine cleavage system aminomethyltransferase GcvT [Tissierella praeacuta]HAE91066.1 glycine cleavage system aminomethyltransferase GcvT [Tissierella sp.]MBU5256305.1 glycine cleavage system aminomethyltransferase GcvT [Tissierella praeacuta]TCU69673.1 aminomethyltransferase [Tissierella praeacuta]SHF02895.1 aminomethyltransferase [Tissierella praeacuta DSM 18095]SUP03231.1 Aminomethyltransferase [Tissierella praeacuta]